MEKELRDFPGTVVGYFILAPTLWIVFLPLAYLGVIDGQPEFRFFFYFSLVAAIAHAAFLLGLWIGWRRAAGRSGFQTGSDLLLSTAVAFALAFDLTVWFLWFVEGFSLGREFWSMLWDWKALTMKFGVILIPLAWAFTAWGWRMRRLERVQAE